MSEFDLLVRAGTVVTAGAASRADLGVVAGQVVAVKADLEGSAAETIDASGRHVFPGLIDSHVHFNEPGRTEWEGFETGSRALAAGGGTLFFDMPLNAHPPTLDAPSFREKLQAAQAHALVDFAFWGGLVPGNLDHLEELSELGVVGFKAFMADSGISDFPHADDRTLHEGMKRAARLGLPVAVHAESQAITSQLTREKLARRLLSVRDFLESRPIQAELEAIDRALDLAGDTGCALHIVHVSCGAGVAKILAARSRGVDVTCETCPHYLALTEEDMVALGGPAKCAPPLRSAAEREALWESVKAGRLDTIGSDHSPAPPSLKTGTDFFKVWGGISGVQQTLPILLGEGHVKRAIALPLLAKLFSCNVAARFKLPQGRGQIALGAPADLALVDLRQSFCPQPADLFQRHPVCPYLGRTLTGRVVQTILRGRTVFRDGQIVSKPMGRLVRPAQARQNKP